MTRISSAPYFHRINEAKRPTWKLLVLLTVSNKGGCFDAIITLHGSFDSGIK